MSINEPKLRIFLLQYFNTEELRMLCFDLAIDYDNLPGATKSNKVLELIFFMERRNRLDDLVEMVRRYRPYAYENWDDSPAPPALSDDYWDDSPAPSAPPDDYWDDSPALSALPDDYWDESEPEPMPEPPPEPTHTEPSPRYADFAFYYDKGNRPDQKVPESHTLQVARWYQLEVAIRAKPTGIPSEELERRPIREPKQEKDVTVMVTVQGDDFEIVEPVQTLMLPPLGDSTENALFKVRPLRESFNSENLSEIKVRLYYEFNLLEVVVISAEVVGQFGDPIHSQLTELEKPISFRQERLEREYIDFDNVQPRTMHVDITKLEDHFLFNFAFFNDIDQKLVFTAPARISATDLEDNLVSIRNIWYDIAMSETFTKQLEGDANEFLKNIRKLAQAGRKLWIKLFKHERRSSMYKIGEWLEKHPLKKNGIVQVSLPDNAANFIFPWSLIYDQPVPRKAYELPDIEGFWGVRYCIEQQLPNIIKDIDAPTPIQENLKVGFMLWNQFKNADKQISLMERMMIQSTGKLDISIPPIIDADSCYDHLLDCDSHVLYFYTHGYTRHRQADIGVGPNLKLFVSRYEDLNLNSSLRENYRMLYESIKRGEFDLDRSWIELTYGKLYLDELYDYVESLKSAPLVILNMCESAQVTPSLSDSFIHFFLDRGAKGVIGTECPMTVEFAHPFAERFLTEIFTNEQVGIVLLNVRRRFLALKNPLGLAYNLYGSATVRFEPSIFQSTLVNGNFSAPWRSVQVPGPHLGNQEPHGWTLEWLPCGQPLYDDPHNLACEVPECVHKLSVQLPADEQLGAPNALILAGDKTYKIFSATLPFGATLSQTVTGLKPNTQAKLVAPVQVHLYGETDPSGVESGVWVNGEGGWVNGMDMGDRRWHRHTIEFTVPEDGVAEIAIRVKSRLFSPKDFFIDGVELDAEIDSATLALSDDDSDDAEKEAIY